MIKALLSIIQKNFKTIGRSKFSLMAIILVPLLVIILTGFAFNSSGLNGISVGVYSGTYSNLTTNILHDLENQSFSINKMTSDKECLSSVKTNENQICIIFPANLSKDGNNEEVVFYVDESRLNIADDIVNKVNFRISTESSNISMLLAQDLITSLSQIKNSLPDQNSDIQKLKQNIQLIFDNSNANISAQSLQNASDYLIAIRNSTIGLNLTNSTIASNVNKTLVIISDLNSSILATSTKLNYLKNQSQYSKDVLDGLSNKFNLVVVNIDKTKIVDAKSMASPIKTKIEPINTSANNKNYFTPTILALIALFGSILLSSTFILGERKSKAYFRNFITPTGDFTFLLGNYLTCLIILIAQFFLVLAGIEFILKIQVFNTLPQIGLVLFLSLSVFTLMGMFIGYLFKSEETTIFAGVLVAALMMFFSNAILPIEAISSQFKKFALFNPLVACNSALKKIMMFDLSLSSISAEIYILLGFFIVFAILSYLGRRITKRIL